VGSKDISIDKEINTNDEISSNDEINTNDKISIDKRVGAISMQQQDSMISTKQQDSMSSMISMTQQESMEVAKSALTLTGEEQQWGLLRGISLNALLHFGATVLADSEGSALTYQLAKPVDMLDKFLSHNWAVGRYTKFACLAWRFNMVFAMAAMLVVGGLLVCLEVAGVIPVISAKDLEWAVLYWDQADLADAKLGFFAFLAAPPVFMAALFFKHDLLGRAIPGESVFLDKVSIHQTDAKLQRAGILKLGAFPRALDVTECTVARTTDHVECAGPRTACSAECGGPRAAYLAECEGPHIEDPAGFYHLFKASWSSWAGLCLCVWQWLRLWLGRAVRS